MSRSETVPWSLIYGRFSNQPCQCRRRIGYFILPLEWMTFAMLLSFFFTLRKTELLRPRAAAVKGWVPSYAWAHPGLSCFRNPFPCLRVIRLKTLRDRAFQVGRDASKPEKGFLGLAQTVSRIQKRPFVLLPVPYVICNWEGTGPCASTPCAPLYRKCRHFTYAGMFPCHRCPKRVIASDVTRNAYAFVSWLD